MTKEQKKQYSMRISQSNRTQIVVIIYEIIEAYIVEAQAFLKEDHVDEFRESVKKSRQFLNQLSSNLDFKYQISFELMNLYQYANQCLVQSELKGMDIHLDVVLEMMNKLRAAFEQVAKSDTSGPAMNGREQVYEGLTYGRDGRNKVSVQNLYS